MTSPCGRRSPRSGCSSARPSRRHWRKACRSPRSAVSPSGNGKAPDGRDHWPYCYTGLIAGAGIKRGVVYGKSDATGSTPVENPTHPTAILATVYHALGISPDTIIYNHLNQPRELVKGKPITALF